MDGNRIFCTDIDIALLCSDSISHDSHAFDDRIRISFKNGTIHECARVSFIRVADDIFLRTWSILLELPLHARREACSASSAQAGLLHDIDDFLRRHRGHCLAQCLIAVHGNVFGDIFRIDLAAVAQGNAFLLLVEVDLVDFKNLLMRLTVFIAEFEILDDSSFVEMLGDDALDILRLHMGIEYLVRVNGDNRPLLA